MMSCANLRCDVLLITYDVMGAILLRDINCMYCVLFVLRVFGVFCVSPVERLAGLIFLVEKQNIT